VSALACWELALSLLLLSDTGSDQPKGMLDEQAATISMMASMTTKLFMLILSAWEMSSENLGFGMSGFEQFSDCSNPGLNGAGPAAGVIHALSV
jgi:hypothetical protein